MNRAIGVTIVALAVVGGAWWMMRSDGTPAEDDAGDGQSNALASVVSDAPRRRDRATSDGDLEGRVAQLEREVAMLKRQTGLRSAAMAARGRNDDDEGWDEAEPAEPQFADGVRQVLEEEKVKERERWVEARREGWEEMSNEILDELVEQAGISPEHRETLFQAWAAEADQVLPLVMQARSGEVGWRDIREQIEEIRSETDASAKELLSEEQYAAYQEARPRPGGRRGGPDDRGGRGGERGGPPPGP